jgi:hypothetical protein
MGLTSLIEKDPLPNFHREMITLIVGRGVFLLRNPKKIPACNLVQF